MKSIKNYILGSIAILYAFFLLAFVKDIGEAVAASVKVCLEVMIPSLYAFMVISGFIVSSGLYAVLGKPFGAISRYVFKIPEEYFSVFIIGSIGGYPVGAKLLAELYKENKIERGTAETMLSYCYLAGPAFICSIKIGLIIFASAFCANIILGFAKGIGKAVPPRSENNIKLDISMECFIDSIASGAKGMFSICAVIVFFSSIICILDKLNIIKYLAGILSKFTYLSYSDSVASIRSFIEISNITLLTERDLKLVPLAASLLSFGGICVTIQTKGFVSGILSTKCFYFSRIIASIISYFLCKIFIIIFNADAVYTSAEFYVYRQNSPIPSVFLLIMTILLLLNISIAKRKNL